MNDNGTVFIVDDDEGAAASLQVLMTSINVHSCCYQSAEDFLAAFSPTEHGCLIVDLRMQGMTGLQLLEQMRNQDVKLPVIIVSGHICDADREAAITNGAIAVYSKPYRSADMCECVRNTLVASN